MLGLILWLYEKNLNGYLVEYSDVKKLLLSKILSSCKVCKISMPRSK